MRGAVLYGPRDVRFEERPEPKVVEPTAAIIRLAATCICGSDLWPYRGIQPVNQPTPMGHEYCGIIEEVGGAVRSPALHLFAFARVLLPARPIFPGRSPSRHLHSPQPGAEKRPSGNFETP